MVDTNQIKQWLKEGTITQAQASKMLSDSTQEDSEEKSNKFISIVAIIGAVLIFIGFAWLIARNWHQIPSILKILILLGSTLLAFVSGVLFRQNNHEGIGRSLTTLGALLFILSLFLISQTYHLATTPQHYAWLLFIAWTFILITAYLLDSPENVIVSMITFFPWVIVQYLASLMGSQASSSEGMIFCFVLIFLSTGAILFGLSVLHNSLQHKFTNIYRFWTVFYFLLIFYIFSFQSFLPILSEYSFESGAFSFFLIAFILLCILGFIISSFISINKKSSSLKEIMIFLGILVLIFVMALSTKAGAGLVGTCSLKTCYDFKTSSECSTAPSSLLCEWKNNQVQLVRSDGSAENQDNFYCTTASCYDYKTELGCNSARTELNCSWNNDYCTQTTYTYPDYTLCSYNDKSDCQDKPQCIWYPSRGLGNLTRSLPTQLWLLWILNNILFIGFIILVLWYGQIIGSAKIVNLALFAFILEVITRYIGFWFNFKGYLAFSLLAILGGLILIFGSWLIPKWRRKLLDQTQQRDNKS